MLNPELFSAFLAAATALVLLPGPIVALVVASSIAHGTRTGLATVAGASTGNALLVTLGALGLSTALALLSGLLEMLRWAGIGYLLWLGVREWRSALRRAESSQPSEAPHPSRKGRSAFAQGLLVAVTNPKTIFFYFAFFPQFIDPALPAAPQLAAMSIAMVVIAVVFDSCYAVLAGRARPLLAGPLRTRIRAGLTGSLLIGTGIGLALTRR